MLDIKKWWGNLTGESPHLARAKTHINGGAHALRSTGLALITGGALGALDAKLEHGLDHPVDKEGKHKIPIDGAVGVACMIGTVAFATEEYSTELRNAGNSAFAVLSYRKGKEFVAHRAALSSGGGAAAATGQVGAGGTGKAALSAGAGKAPAAHGETDRILEIANQLSE